MKDDHPSHQEALAKLRSLIENIEICSLVTLTAEGELRARPMATQELDDNQELWFYTTDYSPKVDNVRLHPEVCVVYADPPHNRYVSVSGKAELVRDKAKIKELWKPQLIAWFPKGTDDPDIALIRVRVVGAQYWDSPNSKLVHLFGMLKALATGQSAAGSIGESEKVSVRQRIGSDTAT
jgi:general stress protein 26